MINDDFNFEFGDSEFPVSIEEFAAYLDENLQDDEMQRIESVTENDETMQCIMDSMEQSEITPTEYGQEDLLLSKVLDEMDFFIPEADQINVLAVKDYSDSNPFELPQIEEHHYTEESHSDIDYSEIDHDEETFDNGIDYGEYNNL